MANHGSGEGRRHVRVAGSLPPLGESYTTKGGRHAAELAQPVYTQVWQPYKNAAMHGGFVFALASQISTEAPASIGIPLCLLQLAAKQAPPAEQLPTNESP